MRKGKTEYQVGDLVEIINDKGGHGYEIGEIVEIIKVRKDYYDGRFGYEGAWRPNMETGPFFSSGTCKLHHRAKATNLRYAQLLKK